MATLSKLKLKFKLPHSASRTLPFIVIGAVTGGTSGLLFAANVDAQVFYAVVFFVAVHVVNEFVFSKRSTQVLRHSKAMRHNWLPGFLHTSVQRKKVLGHLFDTDHDVPIAVGFWRGVRSGVAPYVRAFFHRLDGAGAAETFEVVSLHFAPGFRRSSLSQFFAPGAPELNHDSGAPEIPRKVGLTDDGGVCKRPQIFRSWHICLA